MALLPALPHQPAALAAVAPDLTENKHKIELKGPDIEKTIRTTTHHASDRLLFGATQAV